ncbi:MAG: trypsin-like peptidase domain-containing protein [Gemmatales bacterium]|nr:trypsin-like peptidase domain-containing protein [Gemmatales bacterium]MDW7995358.1 trypsin-like peptidase domain-containing protein [Gemmatales bacterium]
MRSVLLVGLVLAFAPSAARADALRIVGETKYKPHQLVRLKAEGVDAKAALMWRVYPAQNVQRATTPRHLLEFAAHPGTYEVELLVITSIDGALSVEEARTSVTIEPCSPSPPKPPEGGKLDPVNAIGRIRFGNAGCTATVIGLRRPDGKWDVLTAAHCVSGVGARGTIPLKDGRSLGIRIVAHYKGPDVAWCVTDDAIADLPYALIAAKNPDPGTAIWHTGYGVDQPGNREDGAIAAGEDGNGQLRMTLSVSGGDSGGGIFRADTNELVSVVCCASGMGRKVAMWGASTAAIRRTQHAATTEEAWVSLPTLSATGPTKATPTITTSDPPPSRFACPPEEAHAHPHRRHRTDRDHRHQRGHH